MNIRHTHHLTDKQIADVRELLGERFPLADGSSFYLLYQPKLVCVLVLILPDDTHEEDAAAECFSFTHPAFRQKGCFTRLFKEALPEFEDLDLIFPVDPSCDSALKTLRALGAEFVRAEYRMDLELSSRPSPRPEKGETGKGGPRLSLSLERQREDGQDCPENITLSIYLASLYAGVCRVSLFDRQKACLYGFEMIPDLRGQGLGTQALSLTLDFLRGLGLSRLFLHVSGDNPPALRLYKKTGFRITEALSYYLY